MPPMRLRIPFIFDDIGGADAPVKWEYEFRGHYDAYEQGNNDKIEAAYQKHQANKSRHTRGRDHNQGKVEVHHQFLLYELDEPWRQERSLTHSWNSWIGQLKVRVSRVASRSSRRPLGPATVHSFQLGVSKFSSLRLLLLRRRFSFVQVCVPVFLSFA